MSTKRFLKAFMDTFGIAPKSVNFFQFKTLYKGDFESTPESLHSANNVLTSIVDMPYVGTMTNTHTYEYDGDYPVKNVIEMHSSLTNTKTVVTYTYL